jgi:integrase
MPSSPLKFSLFKRNNGKYYVLYVENGRRRWKSTGVNAKCDALKVLTDLEKLFSVQNLPKTLHQFSHEFLAYAKTTFAHHTWLIYSGAFSNLLKLAGNPAMTSLAPQLFDAYKVKRLEEGKSPVTVNIELRAIKAAMNTAIRWKYLNANPLADITPARAEETSPTYFTKQDFRGLLNAITEEWLRELVVFAALTGMRRGELVNLRWEDVDLRHRLIFIQSNPTFRTKQGKRRVVPMSDVVFNLLSAKAERVRCEYIFHLKGFKISDDHASKKLKSYVRVVGLDGKLHFHSLRHTFASWLVQDGVSLYEVQKLLGHSNIAVTQVYSHLQPERLHNTVNRISLQLN